MNNPERMPTLLNELEAAKREYYRLRFDEEYPHELGEPASRPQLARLEQIIGRPVPASYREFLALHNGWSNFDGDGKLLAVEDQGSEWVKERLEYWSNLWDEDAENPFEHGAIPVLLGEIKNSFLVLDPRRVRKDGGMDFVLYDYMQEDRVYQDFADYLQRELEITRQLIERETHGLEDAGEGEE
jgi:hypothetical protein